MLSAIQQKWQASWRSSHARYATATWHGACSAPLTRLDRFVEQQARLIGISEVVSKSDRFSVLVAKARNLLYPTAARAETGRSLT